MANQAWILQISFESPWKSLELGVFLCFSTFYLVSSPIFSLQLSMSKMPPFFLFLLRFSPFVLAILCFGATAEKNPAALQKHEFASFLSIWHYSRKNSRCSAETLLFFWLWRFPASNFPQVFDLHNIK